MSESHEGFIISRHWRDHDSHIELELWLATAEGPVCLRLPGQENLFFLPAAEGQAARDLLGGGFRYRCEDLALQDFAQQPVQGYYFSSQRQLRAARERLSDAGLDPLEADVGPVDRYLMERFVQGSLAFTEAGGQTRIRSADYTPELKALSIDIETAMRGVELFSIAAHGVWRGEVTQRVFMRGSGSGDACIEWYPDEASLLAAFCDWLQCYDPDVLIGWNVVNFDLWFLQRLANKLRCPLPLGRGRRQPHWRELDNDGERRTVQVPGRAVIDGIEMLRTATYRFESFSLEQVSRELLGQGKLLHGSQRGEEIAALFHGDQRRLAEYNLRDCELVWDIFEQTGLLSFAIARSQMTGLALDRLGGSVAAFDFLYLPRLHRAGFVAPNASRERVASPGGFVLDSMPGIYDDVLVLDFKSLYPSIIRSFLIDPLGLALGMTGEQGDTVPGFLGARFSRSVSLLPDIIEQLWSLRDKAKADDNQALSQAIKIIMNSFYGVLGSPGCRFFDARLATSITRRGHQIIQQTRDRLEALGETVIYGDTDSVFVRIDSVERSGNAAADVAAVQARGRELQRSLNDWWAARLRDEFGVASVLELEFETHYLRFLMPTIRGSDKGSKKRYAGVVERNGESEVIFKGLENVRTDWTRLAREFQSELYTRVFMGRPYREYILDLVARLEAGQLDDKLVYRKRLRRRLQDYEKNVPPHVQAARRAEAAGEQAPRRGDWVEYVITSAGPEPADAARGRLDYRYYLERQLAPVADGILHFLDTSFAEITGPQKPLF